MKNYYKESLKKFKNYIKENPNITREEWDKYAKDNCLFSATTLEAHENVKSFEELRNKIIKLHK